MQQIGNNFKGTKCKYTIHAIYAPSYWEMSAAHIFVPSLFQESYLRTCVSWDTRKGWNPLVVEHI